MNGIRTVSADRRQITLLLKPSARRRELLNSSCSNLLPMLPVYSVTYVAACQEQAIMVTSFMGGCACGAIRYECSAAPIFALNCHCRDCQRATGTAYASVLRVPAKAFRVTQGEPRFYTVTADSGNTVS